MDCRLPTADCRLLKSQLTTHHSPLASRRPGREEAEPVQDPRLRQACQDFESFLLHHLFREMRKTAEVPGGALPSSSSSQVLRDLNEESAARQLVGQLHCGLAELLYTALKRDLKLERVTQGVSRE